MLFRNVTLVLPDRIVPGGSLRVRGGQITDVFDDDAASDPHDGEETIDGAGAYLAPGFVDGHVHGAAGRDTMEGTPGAFDAILAFHAQGGTTGATLTTTAAPFEQILDVLAAARRHRASPGGAELLGIHVEGPYFAPAKAGAHRPEWLKHPTPAETARLLDFADVITQVTLAPELPGALDLIEALHAREVLASGGHSDAWDHEAAAAHSRGMTRVTHVFNAMSSARRRDGVRYAGLLEYALAEPSIQCEAIADSYHVTPTLLRLLLRAKGPDGVCLVTDATAGAGLSEGASFPLAGNMCVVRRGVGVTAAGGALAGSVSTMIDGVRHLVRTLGVPLHEAVRMASTHPAAALRRGHERGRLAPGLRADLVLLSDTLETLATYVGGTCVFLAKRPGT